MRPAGERFEAAADALEGLYRAEVARLAAELEERIRAGEFSGTSDEGPRHAQLRGELECHPWLVDERTRLLVFACSRWRVAQEEALGDLVGWDEDPANAMAHDVLAEAAARGWVKPMRSVNDADVYAMRPRPRPRQRTGAVPARLRRAGEVRCG